MKDFSRQPIRTLPISIPSIFQILFYKILLFIDIVPRSFPFSTSILSIFQILFLQNPPIYCDRSSLVFFLYIKFFFANYPKYLLRFFLIFQILFYKLLFITIFLHSCFFPCIDSFDFPSCFLQTIQSIHCDFSSLLFFPFVSILSILRVLFRKRIYPLIYCDCSSLVFTSVSTQLPSRNLLISIIVPPHKRCFSPPIRHYSIFPSSPPFTQSSASKIPRKFRYIRTNVDL